MRTLLARSIRIYAYMQPTYIIYFLPEFEWREDFVSISKIAIFPTACGLKMWQLLLWTSACQTRASYLARRRERFHVLANALTTERQYIRKQKTFISQLAHELKNPAMYIRLLIDRLQSMTKGDSQLSRTASEAVAAATRIDAIVTGAWSHLHLEDKATAAEAQKRADSAKVMHNVPSLIEQAYISVKSAEWRPSKKISFEGVYGRNIDVKCYSFDLVQVFVNLLRNSYQALPDEGGKIRVTASRVKPRKGQISPYVRVTFQDSGMGIDGELLERVFEPDFTTKTGPMHGNGLAVARTLIERNGGTIVASHLEKDKPSTTMIVIELGAQDADAPEVIR